MIDWKTVRCPLDGDIRVTPAGIIYRYHPLWHHTEVLPSMPEGYVELPVHDRFDRYYRLEKPDWSAYKEWLREYYNDLDTHEEDMKKCRVYQTIVSIMIEGGSTEDVSLALFEEALEAKEGSFRQDTMFALGRSIQDRTDFTGDEEGKEGRE